ncbi:MAG TPA: TauD/TfdA family dioxygenase [Burkholderiales bacterium]|nr:TauD/TfdA family dioxygenase [Burkholderiales bacterium]
MDQDLPVAYSTPSGLRVVRLQPAIGAEIFGANLCALSAGAAADIYRALLAHGVVFFRNQPLDYHSHLALARMLGTPIEQDPGSPQPELVALKSDRGAPSGAMGQWHTDGSWMGVPPAITILHAVAVPPLGGDTCFASMTAAYDGLPEETKQRIAPLRARASVAYAILKSKYASKNIPPLAEDYMKRYPPVDHPVVRVHPETGARALYVNEDHTSNIVGLPEEESRELMRELLNQFRCPEYQMRWHWEKDSVTIWDNRAVQHYAVPDQIGFRHVERIELAGTPPMGVQEFQKTAMTAP